MAATYDNVDSLLGTGELVDNIPGQDGEAVPSMNFAKEDRPYGAKDYIYALPELGFSALSDLLSMPAGSLYGLGKQYITNPETYGTQEGVDEAGRLASEAMEKISYKPTSKLASDIYTGVGEFLEEKKLDAPLPMFFTQPSPGIGSLRYTRNKAGEAIYDAAENLSEKYAQSPYSGIQYMLPPNEKVDFAPDSFMGITSNKQIEERANITFLKDEETKKESEVQLQKNELEKENEITKGDASLSDQEKSQRLAVIARRIEELPKRNPEKVDVLTSSFQNFVSKVGKYSVKGKNKDPFYVSFMDASDSPNAKKSRGLMLTLLKDFVTQSVGQDRNRPIKGTTTFGYQGLDYRLAEDLSRYFGEDESVNSTKIKNTQKLANENFEIIRSQKEHDKGNTKGFYIVPTQDFSRPELKSSPEGLGSSAFILYQDGKSQGAFILNVGQPFTPKIGAVVSKPRDRIIDSGGFDVEGKYDKKDRGVVKPIIYNDAFIEDTSIKNSFFSLLDSKGLLNKPELGKVFSSFEKDLERLKSKKLITTLSSMANQRLLSGPDEDSPIPITHSIFQKEILIPKDFVPTASNTQRLIQKYADSNFQGPDDVQLRSEFISRVNKMIPLLANHMLFTYNTPESLLLGGLRNSDISKKLREQIQKDFSNFDFQRQGALEKLPEVLQNKVIVDAISYSLGKQIQKQGVYNFDSVGLESFTTPLSGFSRLDSLEELQNFLATKGDHLNKNIVKSSSDILSDAPSGAFSPYYAPSNVRYGARDVEEANRTIERRQTPSELINTILNTTKKELETEKLIRSKGFPRDIPVAASVITSAIGRDIKAGLRKEERSRPIKDRGLRAASKRSEYDRLKLQNLLLGLEIIDPTIRTYASRGADPRNQGSRNFDNVPGVREYPLFSQTTSGGIPVEMRGGDFLYNVNADIIRRKVNNLRSPFTMDQFFSPNFKEAVPNYIMNTNRSGTIFSKLLDAFEKTPIEKLKDKKGEPLPFTQLVGLIKGANFLRPETVINKIAKAGSKELPKGTKSDISMDQKRTQFLVENFSPKELMIDTELFFKTSDDPLSLEGWYQNTSVGGLKVRGKLLDQCIGLGSYNTCVPSEKEFNKFKADKKIFNWFDENGIPRITYYINKDTVQPTGGRKDVMIYSEGIGQNHPRGAGDFQIEDYNLGTPGKEYSVLYLEKIQQLRNYVKDNIDNAAVLPSTQLDKAMKEKKIVEDKDG